MTSLRLTLFMMAIACGETHARPECGDGSECPTGLVCDPPHGEGLVAQCVPDCDPDVDGRRCENGAFCWGQCSAGGLVPEGGIVASGPGSDTSCAFGLAPAYDFTAEPLLRRCVRVCDTNTDCRATELCYDHECRPACGIGGTPCEPPNLCVRTALCTNPRRFARIDCDADMDLNSECSPALTCDPEAVGGCSRPAPGTE